ncbi:hypothetical protein [Marinobacter sp.]|uniref:hypothetical protein n=1 Tax=Marinobacter sp. TaxID=50741 RepID=UPI0019AA3E18|nr:hypothetical protein [Marinobacter sp.]MBC7190769.1 hypothetical protein [Marinobacter sp.]
MPDQKLKLSDELLSRVSAGGRSASSDAQQIEALKTERASIEAGAKTEVARLQVAKEAIEAFKAGFEVIKSHNQLKSTIAEWQGRVTQAEIEVKKAEVSLQTARENNHILAEELVQSRDLMDRILELFDFTMAELKNSDCSKDEKTKLRRELLEIADRLVKFKK